MRAPRVAAAAFLMVFVIAATETIAAGPTPWVWNVPRGFPIPSVPEDNPMSREKVALGRLLFYDVRLSGNQNYSCGSCHRQELAFTDGLPRAEGSTGELHRRSTPSLANVAYSPTLTWGDPMLKDLAEQARIPMFGIDPIELGLSGEDELVTHLADDGRYRRMFAEAFTDETKQISVDTVTKALASFVRTLISGNSPFDRYTIGLDDNAISASALRGANLFFSERLECFHCHQGVNFIGPIVHQGQTVPEGDPFFNTGLYNIGGAGSYPAGNEGVKEHTGRACDAGKFKTVTLRNIAVTAPYMHDGSIETLDGVIDHYAAGGRTIADGPDAGVGSENPYKGDCDSECQFFPCAFSQFLKGFRLSPSEKQDLVHFLESLTDEEFLANSRQSDPFAKTACPGDCNEDGVVTTDELVETVNLALDRRSLSACVPVDQNADGMATVDEVVAAVAGAIDGCR